MKKIILLILVIVFLAGAYLVFINRFKIREHWDLWYRKKILPPAQEFVPTSQEQNTTSTVVTTTQKKKVSNLPVVTTTSAISTSSNSTILPEEINLAVPFVSQAPFRNWDEVHNETCEEASVLMVNGFYKKEIYTRQEMEDNLLSLVEWQKEKFGFFEDTNVEETVQMMREFFGFTEAKVIYDITVEDIKKELAAGRPVIIPAAGKLLPNPYFRNGGPVYHMLVLKGYTKDGKFISNDPGTNTLGENFTYEFGALYDAIHDWVKDGDILTGRKAMIVVK